MSPKETPAAAPPPSSPPSGKSKRPIPGLVRMSMEDYQAHPALSRSLADRIARSPRHLLHYKETGGEDSQAMLLGRAFHALLLEAETFFELFAVWDGSSRRGKAWEDFKAANEGKDIITADELRKITAAAASFRSKELTRGLLDGAIVEAVALATIDGVERKARPDIIKDSILYDLKSAADASFDGFTRAAYSFGYHRQAAWYLDVVAAATGIPLRGFGFIAVEKEAPYEVQVFLASPEFIAKGRQENRANLELYRACEARGEWPGYPDVIQTLGLPRWIQ